MPEMQTHKEALPVLLTPREVAAALRVDLSTVYRWVHVRTIDAVQFGPSGYYGAHPRSRAPAPLKLSFEATRRRGGAPRR